MKISEQTQKDINRAFKALEDIKIISEALLSIMEWECCDYGHEEAADLAEKYLYEEDEDDKS